MFKKSLHFAIGLLVSLMLGACGGGGGSTDTTNNTQNSESYTYNLKKFSESHTATAELAGTIKTAEGTFNITATIISDYDGTDVLQNGNTVHLQSSTAIIELLNNSIITQTIGKTYEGVPVYSYNQTTGEECLSPLSAEEIEPLPENATANYISDVMSLVCSNGVLGDYEEGLVRIIGTSGQYAQVEVIFNTYTTQGGTLTYTAKTIYTIDPNLKISKIQLKETDLINNIEYDLQSTTVVNH